MILPWVANCAMKTLLIFAFLALNDGHYFLWVLLIVASALIETIEKELLRANYTPYQVEEKKS
jgi:hypothetical protein